MKAGRRRKGTLTEADLISLMENHGIGTDATHAEHIEKIKTRDYTAVVNRQFHPCPLGIGLVEGYETIGTQGDRFQVVDLLCYKLALKFKTKE